MLSELKQLRADCLEISHAGQDGNLQSAFSSLEILWTLYTRLMNWTVQDATASYRDICILSKGQSTLAMHAVFLELGLLKRDEVMTFCQYDSRISMQADRTKFPEGGFETSAGSLGHGFPTAVGMAWARKIKNIAAQVYVLAGDGEMNEGTMWEAAAFASAHHLDNLCLIIDDNDSIGRMLDLASLQEKMQAFGFKVVACDGHNPDDIEQAVRSVKVLARGNHCPVCVLAATKRGYGSKTLMEDRSWFHRAPNAEELATLMQEVKDFA